MEEEVINGEVDEIEGETPAAPAVGVTRDDLAEFAETIGNKVASAVAPAQKYDEPVEEEVDPGVFESVEAFTKYQQARDAQLEARLMAKFQAMQAPMQINAGLQNVTNGLDEVGKQYVENMIADLPPEQKALALNDSKFADMLKRAARDAMNEKTGYIPSSEGVAPRGSAGSLSAEDKADVQELMTSFNWTQKKAIENLQMAKKAVGR